MSRQGAAAIENLCEDCPPRGYPTNETRCWQCPLRSGTQHSKQAICPIHGRFYSGHPECPSCKAQKDWAGDTAGNENASQDDPIYIKAYPELTSGYGIHCDRCGQRITTGEPIVEWSQRGIIIHEDCPPMEA